ncbi:MAG TPA: SGNH/GDSL hydrolase family protein [Rhodanobacteraceae bacterium]|jgi:lysophospholipase L1-like esterase|nr:SGNH/GDSL hydrolase family protein [Rhodanobacteraceae bacterium]
MHSFIALGDSYTIGEGVAESERWPRQLAARLRNAGLELGDPQIVARTGWTTDELATALDAEGLAPPYALVTLLIGVNDQYRGRGLDAYRAQFHGLLQRAVGLAGGDAARVVVVSIPDWGVTPFARAEHRDAREVADQINAFNAEARVQAGRAGAAWVDVTGISRSADAGTELVADGLHPSGAQYTRWSEAILPAARAALTIA